MELRTDSAIVLLSGGLDSTVALAETIQNRKVLFALTFHYGQRALERELKASESISRHYNLPHRVIALPWLEEVLPEGLAAQSPKNEEILPSTSISKEDLDLNRVWVPNRNGLFLNITASLAEAYGAQSIVFGANADEAVNFPDNTEAFRRKMEEAFAYSTLNQVKVEAPMAHLTKKEIVARGIALGVPLNLIWSCYEGGATQCGRCPSCKLLKNALAKNKQTQVLLFNE